MQIDVKNENGKATIAPVGNVDYVTAPELDAVIDKEASKCESMILDFRNVQYISSAGLRSILNADELMQEKGGLKIVNVNNDVAAVLEMTGFYDALDIE